MISTTVHRSMLQHSWRFDAHYFAEDRGHAAFLRVNNGPWPKALLRELVGADEVWSPARFARVYAESIEHGKPYLAPHDCIRYMPTSDEFLSRSETRAYHRYEVKRGWLLITCSGRNLGPCVWVDQYMERFVLSHDMVRVSSQDQDVVFYIMAFLHTPTGQQLIRRDKNGSVIDHIGPKQAVNLLVPLVDEPLRSECSKAFLDASLLRERARLSLDQASKEFEALTGVLEFRNVLGQAAKIRRFEINRTEIGWRFDAEPHAPMYTQIRRFLTNTGCGARLDELAEVRKPTGRYKTYYVPDEHGIRLLSGRQVAQFRPIALKSIAPFSLPNPESFRLARGWIVMTADGRAEERLADCAVISSDRENWAASGHVHRLVAREGIHPGLLYLACTSDLAQASLRATATGSVVDALSVEDVQSTIVPYPNRDSAIQLGDAVVQAWDDFARAGQLEDQVARALELAITE